MNCSLHSGAKKSSTFLGKVSRTASFALMLLFSFLTFQTANSQILINEFMASNGTTILDPADGLADDWIEIYNAGNSSVNIGGYYITDDLTSLTEWQIPTNDPSATTIPAGGYLILWADKESEQGVTHVEIKLGSGGEDLALIASDGTTIIDSYTFGPQLSDISEGRVGDGNSNWDFFGEPTPGATNDTDPGAPFTDTPTASVQGGFYSGNVTVSVSGSGDLHYTTDGSDPTESDPVYTGPLTFNSTTPLRVRAFDPPAIPSIIMTQTYLFDMDHDFAVIAYTIDPVTMFDPNTGMYTQYLEDIEVPVNVEFFEPDGTLGFNMIVESEIQGTASAQNDQKSLALKAKSSLGSSTIPYQVYPDTDPDIDEYRSLTLRNSGQDWNLTMFRDAMASSLIDDLSDVDGTIVPPDTDVGNFRPGVVYINGEYWGIHNVRERMDKRYIRVHFDLDDDEIDFLENDNEAKEGDFVEWEILETFLENNTLTSQSNYDFVDSKVDMSNYIDQLVFMMYIDNQDWPGNNNIYFRERADDAEWRWMVKDLDFSFGLFVPGQPWNSGFSNYNTLDRMSTNNGFNWPAPAWSTLMYRRLVQNDQWRTDFINRFADQLNVLFSTDRVTGRIDQFKADYTDEIVDHADRWFGGFLQWDSHVQKMRNFAETRTDNVRDHIIGEYSDVTGTSNITVNLNSASQGEVELSTILVKTGNAPFTGTYFSGIEVPVTAYPNRGYILQSWSGAVSGNNPTESFTLGSSNATITANFTLGSTSTQPIVINEINYNSPDAPNPEDWVELHNPTNSSVDVSGWYFEDESGDFFGLPANTVIPAGGYLVLVEDAASFSAVYPNVPYIGEFGKGDRGFGLSGGGELITLKNANGVLIDEVEYDDKAPWPTEPDGDGPTLQLINPSLDNALASSWQGIPATPGAENGTSTGPSNQTINFPSLSNKLTTDGPFSISATATSGLPVSFSIQSGPASISGNTITLDGTVGTVTVRASQAGNAQWNPAPNVNRTFDVTTPTGGDCDDIVVTTGAGTMTIDGVASAHHIVKVFGNLYNTVYNEVDGNIPVNLSGLVNEVHHLDIQLYNAQWQPICTYTEDVTVGGGGGNGIDLTCPNSFTIIGEQVVNYNAATATTDCPSGGLAVTRTSGPASGTVLAPGSYTVVYEAQDDCGDSETCSFTIGVVPDGSAITLTCPNNITVTGEQVVNYNAATATTDCPSGGLTVNRTSGPASGSSLAPGTYTVVYEAQDDCGGNVETCSFTITVNDDNNPGEYCDASGEQPWQEWIAGVELSTINNPSGKCDLICGYSDFTAISTSVNAGSSYPMTLTVGKSWAGHPADLYWRVWIDYNQDGDFTDAGEMVLEANGGNQNVNESINISAGAATGGTRMRVAAKKGAFATPCENFLKGEVEDYTLNISGGGGGVLTIDCPSNITVTAPQGASNTNVSYNAANANSTCTTGAVNVSRISGPSSGSAFPLGTTTVTYQATDGCNNEETCSFTVTVIAGGPVGDYCTASGSQPWQQWIQNVNFAGIDNTTGKDQYGDFTSLSGTIAAGEGLTISLTPGFSWTQTDMYFRVWIDYNQDGDFDDADELATSVIRNAGTPPTTSAVTRLITVPTNASQGNTRMRVAMQSGSYRDDCGTFTLGEVEDYTINISGNVFVYTNPDAEYVILNAAGERGSVALRWVTNTEYKNDYFIVERSADGINFEPIIDVEPFGELVNTAVYYQEKDELPMLGTNFYRVKQYFRDGTFAYSNIQEMVFEIDPSQIAVFPNPTANEIYLNIPGLVGQEAEISIYNQIAQEMTYQKVDRLTAEAIKFDLSSYRGGMYIMTIKIANQKVISRKFIVAKF